ncbi:MAG TPA: DHA2 family efflux MFS transporter permease subunit, partial [Geminicoccaceae bacterium]|nr:DHA2 family efflux MFS transporter permease subunit [Geminicoccaceae bacterium]
MARAVEESDLQRALVLLTVSSCTMLYSLTITVVNVTLPQLQGALSATPDQVAWVITLNLVATAVATPVTGWIVARFGQRQVMIWAVVGFTVASLLCATATSLAPLLLYRIGQGAFGAPMVPLAQAIVVATYPPERRAVAQGWFGVAVVLGPALGPVLGGYLAEQHDWRWVFLLPVPLCVVALLMVLAFIRDRGRQDDARLDWTGFLALSVAVTCLQLVMDRGERLDWLQSSEIVLLAAAMAASFYVFLVHTLTHERPFISPGLFLDRNFAVGLVFVFVYGMLNFTPITLLPPLLQSLQGYPDSLIGWLLGSRGAGMVLGFFLAGRMGRLDPRIGMLAGLGLVALSGVMLMRFSIDTSFAELAWMGFIQGLGTGLMWVPLSIATFATLPAEKLPEAAALFHLLRNFGSSIFISLSVMAVSRTGRITYAELSEHISSLREATRLPWVLGPRSLDELPDLAALAGEVERQAQLIGNLNAFALYT